MKDGNIVIVSNSFENGSFYEPNISAQQINVFVFRSAERFSLNVHM